MGREVFAGEKRASNQPRFTETPRRPHGWLRLWSDWGHSICLTIAAAKPAVNGK
jgi:hypothetical protein